jgi:hypothetical protein
VEDFRDFEACKVYIYKHTRFLLDSDGRFSKPPAFVLGQNIQQESHILEQATPSHPAFAALLTNFFSFSALNPYRH